jgi:hypothetical protein
MRPLMQCMIWGETVRSISGVIRLSALKNINGSTKGIDHHDNVTQGKICNQNAPSTPCFEYSNKQRFYALREPMATATKAWVKYIVKC